MTIDIAKARALCEADIVVLKDILSRRLKVNGLIIDPYPETFVMVSQDELAAARKEFAEFAAARTLLPEALDEIERLRTRVAELETECGLWEVSDDLAKERDDV